MLTTWTVVLVVMVAGRTALADTPANCSYNEVQGLWTFQESERSGQKTEDCSSLGNIVHEFQIQLDFPDVATDAYGNLGHWTLIYNQGFEVTINQRKYFAFSYYEQTGDNVTSYCDRTFNGWSHDVLVNNWACYVGQKVTPTQPKVHQVPTGKLQGTYRNNPEMISRINSVQKSWTAGHYDRFEGMPLEDYVRMIGGRKSRIYGKPRPAPVTEEVRQRAQLLPESFDWRDVNGINYVSAVRDQGNCGSCYAFSATGMVENRLRVLTNNTLAVTLSPQDVVSCTLYAQGCDGGFPYLIGGKYAQDFGMTEEECDPYLGEDAPCNRTDTCIRRYVSKYQYIGGFYGGCNEELMKEALVTGGPLSVSFEVYDDFSSYTGGIYHHTDTTGLTNTDFNPWEITNHAVLLVGYGADPSTGEKFWSVKNSWGEAWGEQGYFRIRRGTDECSIESLAVEVLPIP